MRRLLVPLVLLCSFALAAPAMAADQTVRVIDFAFVAKDIKVALGDTVTWSFVHDGHTTTSDPGQPDSWNSASVQNPTNPAGTSFQKRFTVPGRFSYFCAPHRAFMKGSVTVGVDTYVKSYSSFRLVRRGRRIVLRFALREHARVVARLSGASRRSATRRRLAPGSHSIVFRALRAGAYRATVGFRDDFDKLTRVTRSTFIG